MPGLENIRQTVSDWCQSILGWTGPDTIEQLAGGANNAVFRCERRGESIIVKAFPEPTDGRPDRFGAECTFLTYANSAAPDYVPKLIFADTSARILAMELLSGTPYRSSQDVSASDINRAANFLRALNSSATSARPDTSQRAADGFLTLSEHIENVAARAEGMSSEHIPQEHRAEALSILDGLKTSLAETKKQVAQAIGGGAIEDAWPEDGLILSPSDFGFHNAFKCGAGAVFFDFEFAGWDDPAKTIADFFLQPRVPVAAAYRETLLDGVKECIPVEVVKARADTLTPVLRLKWAAIALSVLQPERWAALNQITFDKSPEMLIRERFQTARNLLSTGA